MHSLSRINMSFSYDDAFEEHLSDAQETEREIEGTKEMERASATHIWLYRYKIAICKNGALA